MSERMKSVAKIWKTPDEIIRLQRLKQRQKALQARVDRPMQNIPTCSSPSNEFKVTQKRKNPFLDERRNGVAKKPKEDFAEPNDFASEDSVFNMLATESNQSTFDGIAAISTAKKPLSAKEMNTFTNLMGKPIDDIESDIEEEMQIPTNHVPIDWSLKLKLRLLSNTPISGSRLKSNEEASGITGFVRCADLKSSETGLDISPAARFHQSTMYWQHPHLPWLTLFPRMSKANNGCTIGEMEREALARDWKESFRALFQLVRSLQCPFFYVCANSFTVLFRAAGIGGRVETHALLTPTSRGLRGALKDEEIEFTMPLKKASETQQNKSLDSGTDTQSNSFSNISGDCGAANTSGNGDDAANEDNSDDEDDEKWLANLGVEASVIKKISTTHAKRIHNEECTDDSTDQSILLIEGVECQGLFNFLLNAKSTTTKVGRLAGVPPTILSPVAFPGASLRNVQVRSSIVRMDNVDYHSMEMKGVIMPHTLQYLYNLMKETKDKFSATMLNFPNTTALSKAAQKLIDDLNKENQQATAENVFGRENLSDCGMPSYILESLCRLSGDSVRSLERMCFNKDFGGYTWT